MSTIDLVISSAKKFYYGAKEDEHGRYRSWEYCYYQFYHARGRNDVDVDNLALHLSFYLASWGMFRGSSFLMKKDYKIQIPVVDELLKEKYDPLQGIKCTDLKKESNQKLLNDITKYLNSYYKSVRDNMGEITGGTDISEILITKVLMGTLGCVPAYDTFFVKGIRKTKVANGKFNMKSVQKLAEFYEKNHDVLEDVRKDMKIRDLSYPQMKLLDMGFWMMASDSDFDSETDSGIEETIEEPVENIHTENAEKKDIPELGAAQLEFWQSFKKYCQEHERNDICKRTPRSENHYHVAIKGNGFELVFLIFENGDYAIVIKEKKSNPMTLERIKRNQTVIESVFGHAFNQFNEKSIGYKCSAEVFNLKKQNEIFRMMIKDFDALVNGLKQAGELGYERKSK